MGLYQLHGPLEDEHVFGLQGLYVLVGLVLEPHPCPKLSHRHIERKFYNRTGSLSRMMSILFEHKIL